MTLTKSPQKAPDILEHLHTAVCLLDTRLRIDYMNPAAETLFATSLGHAHGKPIAELLIDPVSIHARMQHSLNNGEEWTEREARIILSYHNAFTADITVTPVGRPPHCQALILELASADRRLRASQEEDLLIQNQTAQALARGLAHEIKNPLGGLRGAAQLLERALEKPELREYTTIIIHEADRLKMLVDTMLGPKTSPQRLPCNIHEPLEYVRTLVSSEMGDDITFITDYDPSLPEVMIDRDQIIQALLNLIRNAAQAVDQGGLITLRTRSQRKVSIGHNSHRLTIRIDIIDNGPGIPDNIRANIFLPMVTGRPEGTGLGLPIAQTLVQQNGGLIECREQDGQTVFSIYLPLET